MHNVPSPRIYFEVDIGVYLDEVMKEKTWKMVRCDELLYKKACKIRNVDDTKELSRFARSVF